MLDLRIINFEIAKSQKIIPSKIKIIKNTNDQEATG